MTEFLSGPWPWYVAGPLLGLVVPALLLYGAKMFGISSSLRHLCAVGGSRLEFFRHDWRKGMWNLVFVAGLVLGGALAAFVFPAPDPVVNVSPETRADLAALGVEDDRGMVPDDLISWRALATPAGFVAIVLGGFLVGFGARWAGGCTSGHAISGIAALQIPSMVAAAAFFVGGLVITHLILPLLLGGGS